MDGKPTDAVSSEAVSVDVGRLSDLVPPNGRIALGDGAGYPAELWPALVDLARARPDVSVLVGWFLHQPDRLAELTAEQSRTVISGFGMRRAIDAGQVGFLPVRLGTVPALMAGPLRVDLLLASLGPTERGLGFTTEVSWQRAAIHNGARVAAIVRPDAPVCDVGPALEPSEVTVLGESGWSPAELGSAQPSDEQRAVAENVAALVPEGARIQIGPGGLGVAIYAALRRPVAVDTGLITDPVVDLDRRGLLDGLAYGPYITGTPVLYDWVGGRAAVEGIEHTHAPGRLAGGRPMVAVNTGLEIDADGQVNAEMAGGSWIGGIGGQPDYAAGAAASPGGLSIIAMATRRGSESTLVDRLQGPVTTPSHDVDVVVTERGVADLRGLLRTERRAALRSLWALD